MPYNELLATRVKHVLSKWMKVLDKNMFGGICYLINGNIACGVYKDFLILRLGEEQGKKAFEFPYVKPFDITGRPMKGWVMIHQDAIFTDDELASWITKAIDFVKSLPSK